MIGVDQTKPFMIKLPKVLSAGECTALINRIESLKPEIAPVNTHAGTRIRTETRNNDRVIFEDESLARMLVDRVQDNVPNEIQGMNLVGANERFLTGLLMPSQTTQN